MFKVARGEKLFYPPSGEYFPRKASTHPCTTRLKINKNSTFTIIEWTGGQDRLQCTKNATTARWKGFMSSYDLEVS